MRVVDRMRAASWAQRPPLAELYRDGRRALVVGMDGPQPLLNYLSTRKTEKASHFTFFVCQGTFEISRWSRGVGSKNVDGSRGVKSGGAM